MTKPRHLLYIAGALALQSFACSIEGPRGGSEEAGDSPDATPSPAANEASQAVIDTMAGSSGSVIVTDTYQNGNDHPGQNAIDVSAPGGAEVWHQLGELPPSIAGGWIFVDLVKEEGLCSGWTADSEYYNGEKLVVYTLFYDAAGGYLGFVRAAYQHVIPDAGIADEWFRWNNADAEVDYWPFPWKARNLGNGTWGGLRIGALFTNPGEPIFNYGDPSRPCHYDDHVHQEGTGWRAAALGGTVEARTHALHSSYLFAYLPEQAKEPPYQPDGTPPPNDEDPGGAGAETEPTPPEQPPEDSGEPDPSATCSCSGVVDNFCQHPPSTPGCPMTAAGGYCDPDGSGTYEDADWTLGWYDFAGHCN